MKNSKRKKKNPPTPKKPRVIDYDGTWLSVVLALRWLRQGTRSKTKSIRKKGRKEREKGNREKQKTNACHGNNV